MRIKTTIGTLCAVAAATVLSACQAKTLTTERRAELESMSAQTLEVFRDNVDDAERWIDGAYAYVVFPALTRAALGIGGGGGDGIVFRDGQPIGNSLMNWSTVGLSAGVASMSQIIFIENRDAFERFTSRDFQFDANFGGVAGDQSNRNLRYDRGFVVFPVSAEGVILDASIGGQKFTFNEWGSMN